MPAELREIAPQAQLDTAQVKALSSPYIDHGLKNEQWEITQVDIDGGLLTAKARMTATFVSPTDPDGFHMSMFTSQEIISQLANIWLHVAAGLDTKCRESWMRECTFSYRQVIRDPREVTVEMDFYRSRWVRGSLLAMARCEMRDTEGGLFEAHLKGMLR